MTELACAAGWLLAAALVVAVGRLRRRLELVARADHELRGPAMALGLVVAALRREPGGIPRALAFESELERMRMGLSDLEAARRGRRGEPARHEVGLELLARGTAAGWGPAALAAGRRLRFRWDGGPALVRADAGRLAQALGNIVANAVEHGSGPVELRGRRMGDRVVVEVRDAGPPQAGRAPERRGSGRLRLPVDRRRGLAGSEGRRQAGEAGRGLAGDRGRGLAIATEAVEDAGGRLTLERGREGGTVAAVELPLAEP